MKIQFKNWLAKIVVITTALFAVQNVMASEGPYELTQKVAGQLFADLKADQAKIKADPNHLKTLVRKNLMQYVHVNYAGSLVLGQHFRSTKPEQREKFFSAFEKYIEQNYAQALTLYKGQDIKVQPAQLSGDNLASVSVRFVQSQPVNVTFQWRKNEKTGKWQAYDMSAEGVSMIQSKKQEWGPILRKDGIDALTAQVQKAAAVPVTMKK